MELEHKGIKITITHEGKFEAVIGGKRVVKPSVDAMKKAIDAHALDEFVPFSAIKNVNDNRGEKELKDLKGMTRVMVTGIQKTGQKKWWSAQNTFATDSGINTAKVLKDTLPNIAAFKAHQAYCDKTNKILHERRVQEEKLNNKVKWITADDYVASKDGGK